MQKTANTSRFLTNTSSKLGFAGLESLAGRGGLFQHAILSRLAHTFNSHQLFNETADKFTRFAEHAYSLRDLETLENASQVLMNLPIEAARQTGLYYHALAVKRSGQRSEARLLLEKVAENGPLAYRARAIQSLGVIHYEQGQVDESSRCYLEALKIASTKNGQNWLPILMAHLDIVLHQSIEGDHLGAIAYLENLSPLMQLVSKQHPLYFYVYHNAIAVDLAEVGRITEAQAASEIALRSPFAAAYPEWAETREEISAKQQAASSSFIALNRAPEIAPSPQPQTLPSLKPVRVLVFAWPACDKFNLQISVFTIAPCVAIADDQVNRRILEMMRQSIQPRAPPSCLWIKNR